MRSEFADVLEAAWAEPPPKARVDTDRGEIARPGPNVAAQPPTVKIELTISWPEPAR